MTKLTTVEEILFYIKNRKEELNGTWNSLSNIHNYFQSEDARSQYYCLTGIEHFIELPKKDNSFVTFDEGKSSETIYRKFQLKEEPQTMIKFITEDNKANELTFKMVKKNQFNFSCYNVIADKEGKPYCSTCSIDECEPIQKILPHVTKIEF